MYSTYPIFDREKFDRSPFKVGGLTKYAAGGVLGVEIGQNCPKKQFGQIRTHTIGLILKKDQPQLPFTQDGPHTEGCTTKFVEGSFSFPGICNGEVQN